MAGINSGSQGPVRGKHAKIDNSSETSPSCVSTSPQSRSSASVSSGEQGSFVPLGASNLASTRSKKPYIICSGILILIIGLYAAVSFFFASHCLPSTTLGGRDVSFMSVTEVASVLDEIASSYTVEVRGDGLEFTINASDAGASIESDRIAEEIIGQTNPLLWPVALLSSRDMTDHISITTGDSGMAEKVRSYVDEFNQTAAPSKNATVEFDVDSSEFVIVPEVYGDAVDSDLVVESVDKAIRSLESSVSIDEHHLVLPTILADDPALSSACDMANMMASSRLEYLVSGVSVATLDSATLGSWVVVDDSLEVSLDEPSVVSWVDTTAGKINTYGSVRTYTRPDGKVCSVTGGSYGWIVDNESFKNSVLESVRSGLVGTFEVPMKQTAGSFDGVGNKDWGTRYVDVDLTEQHARFYEGNSIIWESDIVSGKPDGEHDTPNGIYVLNAKQSPSTLIGSMVPETGKPEYETKVEFWMPFIGNSIGFHDASWQSAFGGTRFSQGYGSHGCVNLPSEMASTLYGLIKEGDVIVVHG